MDKISFTTSRFGRLRRVTVYKYVLTPAVMRQSVQRERFINWLRSTDEIVLSGLENNCFFTYTPMIEKATWQYRLERILFIEPDFSNTALVSAYIGKLLRELYLRYFERFEDHNAFVVDRLDFTPFRLLKCFEFNVEVFPDGDFYIHFLPVSKLSSPGPVDRNFMDRLRQAVSNGAETPDRTLYLVEQRRFRSMRVDLSREQDMERAQQFLESHERVMASFNYSFVASYSTEIFDRVTRAARQVIRPTIDLLSDISDKMDLSDEIELHDKPFYRFNPVNLAVRGNLLVGGGVVAREQSAAFYNGIYKPVTGKVIQPVTVDGMHIDLFYELLARFNKGGEVAVLDPIHLPSGVVVDTAPFIELKRQFGNSMLLAVFTAWRQPNDFFRPLFQMGVVFQLYQGQPDRFRLSNYTVKCLEKLGGNLAVIKSTAEPDTTYFLGVDLGHSIRGRRHRSNLCAVMFDNRGRLVANRVVSGIPRNEALDRNALAQVMKGVLETLKKSGRPFPSKLIIHRDGKLHNQDTAHFEAVIRDTWQIPEFDVVEVIKSGYPVMAVYSDRQYVNPGSGQAWLLEDKRYAVLVTNTQAGALGETLNPIVVRHRYGSTDFRRLVDQVYWFTRVYTNNLYQPTRLPATTEKANNLAGTGDRRFTATYLG